MNSKFLFRAAFLISAVVGISTVFLNFDKISSYPLQYFKTTGEVNDTVRSGQPLTVAKWNKIIGTLSDLTSEIFIDQANHRVAIGTNSFSDQTTQFQVNGKIRVNGLTDTTTLEVAGDTKIDTNTLFVDAVSNEVGIGTTNPSQKLEVTGGAKFSNAIQLGNDTAACTAGKAGTIRWTSSVFEGCDGKAWTVLVGGVSPPPVPQCKTNWVFIPGSENVDGSTKGWCVMKYEATPYGTSGYSVDYSSYNWQDAYDSDVSKKVASLPQNPLNYVSSNNARSICGSTHLVDDVGAGMSGGFPMKYNVFQKLAINLASNPANWSGGAVGSGYIYSGHNDYAPANTITPSSNDADGYINTGQTTGNQKRVLYTSENKAIWDLAGNVWEEMYEQQSVGNSGWNEYTSVTTNAFAPPYIMSQNWNSTQGVGQSYGNGAVSQVLSSGSYWLIRGGTWRGGSIAGLFTSAWSANSLSLRDDSVGVRCIVPAQ